MANQRFVCAWIGLLIGLMLASGRAARAEDQVVWIVLGGGNRVVRTTAMGFRLFASADDPLLIRFSQNPTTGAHGMIFEGPFPDCQHRFHYHGEMFDREDGGADCGWGAVIREEDAPASIAGTAAAIDFELEAAAALVETPPDLDTAIMRLNEAGLALSLTQDSILQAGQDGTIRAQDARILSKALEGPARADLEVRMSLERVRDGQARPGELRRAQPKISGTIKKKRETFRILVKKFGLLPAGN